MHKKWIFAFFSVIQIFLVISGSAAADVAPPLQPPGALPGPPEYAETSVSMDWESVTFRVGDAGSLYYASDTFPTVNAAVSASFILSNNSEETETLEVVFPLMHLRGIGDGRFNFPEIQDFRVRVDGAVTPWETAETPNPYNADDPPLRWAQFAVDFPADKEVFIDIAYDVQSTGYFPQAVFSYVLETGAGWDGPIGDAYLTLIMPYEATAENVLVGKDMVAYMGGGSNPQPEWHGNQVTWNWKDLEPSAEDNWAVTIWAPHIWKEVIALREEMENDVPGAAAKLTTWYDALIIDRGIRTGAKGLVDLNLAAYQQALLDNPWDADVSARYANFLLFLYGHGRGSDQYEGALDDAYFYATYARELDAFNATALDVLNQLETSYAYTPPEKTALPTDAAVASAGTPKMEGTPCPADAIQQDYTLIYLLGGALVIALLTIIILIYRMGLKGES